MIGPASEPWGKKLLLLGVLYAALGAFTFALNNVAMPRGVVTGSVLQGIAIVPAISPHVGSRAEIEKQSAGDAN